MARSNSNSDSNKSDTQLIKRPEVHPPARSQPRQRRTEEHEYRASGSYQVRARAAPAAASAHLQILDKPHISAAAVG
jgi:hypothetical protein